MKLYEKILVGIVLLFFLLLIFPVFIGQYIFFTLFSVILSLSYLFGGYWLFNLKENKTYFIPIFAGVSFFISVLILPFSIIFEFGNHKNFHYFLIANILLIIVLLFLTIIKRKKGGITKNIKFIFLRALIILFITAFFTCSPITFKPYFIVMKCMNNYNVTSVNNLNMNYYGEKCYKAIKKGDCDDAIECALKSNQEGKNAYGIISEDYTNIETDITLLNKIPNDSIRELPEIQELFNTNSNKKELFKISETYTNLYHAYACKADKEFNNNQINEALNDYKAANKYLFACEMLSNDWAVEKSWSLNNIALCYRDLKKYEIAINLFYAAIANYESVSKRRGLDLADLYQNLAYSLHKAFYYESSKTFYMVANNMLIKDTINKENRSELTSNYNSIAENYIISTLLK